MKVNTIYQKSCLDMSEVEDKSIDLVLTSPPYNANKEYEQGVWDSLKDYFSFLKSSFLECYRAMKPGAFLFINVADMHISPEHPHNYKKTKQAWNMGTSAFLVYLLGKKFLYKDEVIWFKGRWTRHFKAKLLSAPGSYCIAVQHEKILIFRREGSRRGAYQHPYITGKERSLWCRSVWEQIRPVHSKNHEAVMPLEMAEGIIKTWSFPDHVILDPFAGLGTTLKAAKHQGRSYIGYEINPDYVEKARKDLEGMGSEKKRLS